MLLHPFARGPLDDRVITRMASQVGISTSLVPVVAELQVTAGGRKARGVLSGVSQEPLGLDLGFTKNWPEGQLTVLGTLASKNWPEGQLTVLGTLAEVTAESASRPHLQIAGAVVVVYRATLWTPDHRVGVDLIWRDTFLGAAAQSEILLQSGSWDDKDIARAARALKFLERLGPRTGRPQGSGQFASADALRETLDPLIAALKARSERATEDRVCRLLPGSVDERTLRRWVKEHLGLTWTEYLGTVPSAK